MNFHKLLTPINIDEERIRYFSSKNYNPIFKYLWTENSENDWSEMDAKNIPLREAILSRDRDAIINEAKLLFETELEDSLLNYSKEILKHKPAVNIGKGPEELIEGFKIALDKFGIEYKVLVTNSEGYNIRPIHVKREVHISKNPSQQFFKVKDILKHEMLHIVRAENTEYNRIPKSNNFLPTEEGFASFVQDYEHSVPTSSIFQHAAEYAVTEVCLNGSLRNAIEFLVSVGFSEDNAWKRSIRHKFGFIDTSLPGDIMKPSMYLFNAEKIKKLTKDEQLRLFVGKISIKDLSDCPEYKGRFSSNMIREYFLD